MTDIYVPSHGQRIVMPGIQPDWPLEGRAVNRADPYQRRLVMDGDLVLKPVAGAGGKSKSKPAGDAGGNEGA